MSKPSGVVAESREILMCQFERNIREGTIWIRDRTTKQDPADSARF